MAGWGGMCLRGQLSHTGVPGIQLLARAPGGTRWDPCQLLAPTWLSPRCRRHFGFLCPSTFLTRRHSPRLQPLLCWAPLRGCPAPYGADGRGLSPSAAPRPPVVQLAIMPPSPPRPPVVQLAVMPPAPPTCGAAGGDATLPAPPTYGAVGRDLPPLRVVLQQLELALGWLPGGELLPDS